MLNVSIKLKCINELLDKQDQQRSKTMNNDPRYLQNKQKPNQLASEGQLISTLHEHENQPVEQLISLENSSFYSIDKNGKAVLLKVNDNKDSTYHVEKKWTYKPNKHIHFTYNKSITSLELANIVYASKHCLYKLAPEGNATFTL